MDILARGVPESVGFYLALAADHRSPATGKAPTLVVSKAGGAFAAPAGSASERLAGRYDFAAAAADLATPGPLILGVAAPACDPTDLLCWVVARPGLAPLSVGVASPLPVLLIDDADGVSGATGRVVTQTILWPDGSTTVGTAAEIGRGWYALAGTPPAEGTADTSATAPGAKSAGWSYEVGPGASGGTPASLRAALRASWIAAGLDATVGPLYSDATWAGTPPPTVVATVRKGSAELVTIGGTFRDYRIALRVRGLSAADARRRAAIADAALSGLRLAWADGASTPLFRQRWESAVEPARIAGGVRAFDSVLEYQTRVLGER